jgi:hypothetical protein
VSRVRISTEELRALEPLDDDEVAEKSRGLHKPALVEAVAALHRPEAALRTPVASDAAVYVPPVPVPVHVAPQRPSSMRTTEPSLRRFVPSTSRGARLAAAVFILACACLGAVVFWVLGTPPPTPVARRLPSLNVIVTAAPAPPTPSVVTAPTAMAAPSVAPSSVGPATQRATARPPRPSGSHVAPSAAPAVTHALPPEILP